MLKLIKSMPLFAVLWTLDTLFTILFTMKNGMAMEANPLMRALLEGYGYEGFIIVKAGIGLFACSLWKHFPSWISIAINILMLGVVSLGLIVAIY